MDFIISTFSVLIFASTANGPEPTALLIIKLRSQYTPMLSMDSINV